jgi:uncharacterized membrane protein
LGESSRPATEITSDPIQGGQDTGQSTSSFDFRRISWILYLGGLALAIATWFSAITTPLWLDETASYWQISAGFSQLWHRRLLGVPAYPFILWVTKSLFGSSAIALRVPSILAMLAAVYVFYRIARELFEYDTAFIATIIFALHPILVFAAIDARPYAFALLSVNCATWVLLRWMKQGSIKQALLFGALCAVIQYFHYLFAAIFPAFLILILIRKGRDFRKFAPQIGMALLAFVVLTIPAIPDYLEMFRVRATKVFADPPNWSDLWLTFDPQRIIAVTVLCLLLVALAARKFGAREDEPDQASLAPLILGFVPILVLYLISVATPIHIFVERYRLVAIPGIALCWGLLLSRVRSRGMKIVFCAVLMALCLYKSGAFSPGTHAYSWEYALKAADASTSADGAPLLICSDYVESNYVEMPRDISESWHFSPLNYHPVHTIVVPLPRELNQVARVQLGRFLSDPRFNRRRFVMAAYRPSMRTVDFVANVMKDQYQFRVMGVYDGVALVEFIPR